MYVQHKIGDLVIPNSQTNVSYYYKKPFIISNDPYIARSIESGIWKETDGPALIVCEPVEIWDCGQLIIPNVGLAWIIYKDYVSLSLTNVIIKIQNECKLLQKNVII